MYAGDTHTHLLLLPEYITKLQLALYQRYTYVRALSNEYPMCMQNRVDCMCVSYCKNE